MDERRKRKERLVTVIVEEDQINTLTCSPRAFIQQYNGTYSAHFLLLGSWTYSVLQPL